MTEPILAITMGDPAGIGPEIIVKALTQFEYERSFSPVVFGDSSILTDIAERMEISIECRRWVPGQPAPMMERNTIWVHEINPFRNVLIPPFGRPSKYGGKISLAAITAAARAALDGEVAGMVTAPVSKESLFMAGCPSLGHTDLLARMCGADNYAMMLTNPMFSVVHATVHCPLSDVSRMLNRDLLIKKIRLAAKAAKDLELNPVKVVVCGFNPHAGENGLIGDEEVRAIAPAVEAALREGMDVCGPLPADTVFYRAFKGEFKMIVAMYHDQGHIPVKLFGLENGVNVTLGFPFVRTSVDHGTAFGKAGRGTADSRSLIAAINLASKMAGCVKKGLELQEKRENVTQNEVGCGYHF